MTISIHQLAVSLADLLHIGTDDERGTFRKVLHASLMARSLSILDEVMVDRDLSLDASTAWANKRLAWLGTSIEIRDSLDDDALVEKFLEDPEAYRRLLDAIEGAGPEDDEDEDEDDRIDYSTF